MAFVGTPELFPKSCPGWRVAPYASQWGLTCDGEAEAPGGRVPSLGPEEAKGLLPLGLPPTPAPRSLKEQLVIWARSRSMCYTQPW